MVETIIFDGQRAWLKCYQKSSRAFSGGILRWFADTLALDALRPPPHRGGSAACRVEARRLKQLRAQGINVPDVIAQGCTALVLEHKGAALNVCLRQADASGQDVMVKAACLAISQGHASGAYFGQLFPRNMTWNGQAVGFIDFEEDPLEVMDLYHAQARDWLMFVYGIAKYYDARPQDLLLLVAPALAEAEPDVVVHVQRVCTQLSVLGSVCKRAGRSGRALARVFSTLSEASALVVRPEVAC